MFCVESGSVLQILVATGTGCTALWRRCSLVSAAPTGAAIQWLQDIAKLCKMLFEASPAIAPFWAASSTVSFRISDW